MPSLRLFDHSRPDNPAIVGYPAAWSPCGRYRYTLWRIWRGDADNYVQFVGLNPSTADEKQDDPTIRRCKRFAQDLGFDAMCMTNLFAFRATDPRRMKKQIDPIGPRNDEWLQDVARNASQVIACWGCHGSLYARDEHVLELLREVGEVHCLRVTKEGCPAHPLYLPANLRPVLFDGTEVAHV